MEARRAHNPEVGGSKPLAAINFFAIVLVTEINCFYHFEFILLIDAVTAEAECNFEAL